MDLRDTDFKKQVWNWHFWALEKGQNWPILELTQHIKIPEIDAKYTDLKQISHTTHSDNIFEVVQYKKFDKTDIEIEQHEIH